MTKIPKKTRLRRRQYAYWRGKAAEIIATLYLRMQGYHILARGFRKPVGEVDIIARRKNMLIAIEVKQRPTLEKALNSIHEKQRRRISRAMEAYISYHPEFSDFDIRFDVILVTSFLRLSVHVKNAW